MKIIDNTGTSRSNEDIQEAIKAIKNELVRGKPCPIMVYYTTMLEGLNEVLKRRVLMKEVEIELKKASKFMEEYNKFYK